MSDATIVGYDGHEMARRALERAIAEAKSGGGSLVIVSVEAAPVDPHLPLSGGYAVSPPAPLDAVDAGTSEPPDLKQLSDEALARAQAEGVPAEAVWDAGDPMRVIVDAAREHGARAIVLGSHHYNVFQRLLGEDVAAAVRRRVDCEVIAVE